jgi:hypothetical protein
MAAWKLAPAIAAGCACILKPAEQTPLTALEFANWFEEVGLPPGVVNIINGLGEVAGAALVAHPGVDKVAFTGSAAVGKIIVKSAADTLKRVALELGGKSPNIFFAEADWEAAVDGALFGVFINQGEVCSAGSRILVEKKIYSRFVESMTEKAKRITLGPPLARETKMGPLVSKEQYDRVSSYLEIGKKEAKVAIGGGPKASAVSIASRPFSTTSKQRTPARNFWPGRLVIPSMVKPTRFASLTIRLTVSQRRCGPATSTRHSASSSLCAPESCGSTTCSQPMSKRLGAVTSSQGSAGSWVRGALRNTSKPSRFL